LKVAVTNQQVAIYTKNGGGLLMGVRDDLEKVALLDAKIYSHIEELERLRHIALGYRSYENKELLNE
jgi:hypothetical protein